MAGRSLVTIGRVAVSRRRPWDLHYATSYAWVQARQLVMAAWVQTRQLVMAAWVQARQLVMAAWVQARQLVSRPT